MWVLSVFCFLVLAWTTRAQGGPPTISPTASAAGFDPDCRDKLDSCDMFDLSQYCDGDFLPWAKDNCALSCGICQGPPTTPLPCVDMLDNCDVYPDNACTDAMYQHWAKENCRRTCRLCPPDVLAVLDSITTTLSPEDCVDKVDCRLYPLSTCTGEYAHWAKDNCPVYCGFCPGVTTTPKPCVDNLPTCDRYQKDTCTNPQFKIWVEDNCAKYCGFCSDGSTNTGGAPPLPTMGPPAPTHAAPPLPGKK